MNPLPWILGGALVTVLVLGGAIGFAAAGGSGPPAPPRPGRRPMERAPGAPGPQPPVSPPPDPSADDQEALARMLASETSNAGARVVIGWITVTRARRRGESVYRMLTKGKGYGAQERDGEAFYASTRKDATAETRDLAAKLLSGEVVPSAAVRRLTPGAWVEQGQGVSDERLVSLQSRWKEGIYARLRGTRWYLYSKDAPPVSGASAAAALDSVPVVDALDSRESVA